jgi:hypothetical protein
MTWMTPLMVPMSFSMMVAFTPRAATVMRCSRGR